MTQHLAKFWLPVVIVGSICMFTLYAVIQQDIRMGANDPQIQLAEDGAAILASSSSAVISPAVQLTSSAATIIGTTRVDMKRSLSPFLIITDDSGKIIASSGFLDGQIPVMPSGVLDYARTVRDNRLTWQPASTTRIAAVVKHFSGKAPGFIIAGRNMREIEYRENQLGLMVGTAWVAILILTLLVSIYSYVAWRRAEEIKILLGQ